jgi:hypothetical protein
MNSNYPFVNDTHNRYWWSIFAELVGEEGIYGMHYSTQKDQREIPRC